VRQVVRTELEKRLVKTLQNSTTPQKCGMSRYPSTSLQKPTSLMTIRKRAVRIRSSFTPNSGMLASVSDGFAGCISAARHNEWLGYCA
jgi:hypothetical protein